MTNLRQHIREEIVFTPQTWQDMNIQFGATFNLAHSPGQMLYCRPRNKLEELDNCYLVGGGTHPATACQRFTNPAVLPPISFRVATAWSLSRRAPRFNAGRQENWSVQIQPSISAVVPDFAVPY
jgi:hypothetical protein